MPESVRGQSHHQQYKNLILDASIDNTTAAINTNNSLVVVNQGPPNNNPTINTGKNVVRAGTLSRLRANHHHAASGHNLMQHRASNSSGERFAALHQQH